MPTQSPIRPGLLFRGTDTQLRITVTGGPLTGQALRWILFRSIYESPLVTKTTAGGAITIDGTDTAVVDIEAEDTSALLPGTYDHRLERTDEGSETVLSYGWAVLEP